LDLRPDPKTSAGVEEWFCQGQEGKRGAALHVSGESTEHGVAASVGGCDVNSDSRFQQGRKITIESAAKGSPP